MKFQKVFILLIFSLFLSAGISYSQNNTYLSFRQQNKTAKYYSISFGMGADYCDNKSLKTFVEYELPFYNTVPVNEKLSTFYTGIEFFGGLEFQLSNKFSIKGDYSYFTKSYNLAQQPNYDFTYYNHQPYLMMYYLIPQENSFIKIGGGAGFLSSGFTEKSYGYQSSYSSKGFGIKFEGVLNLQISKSFSGYLGGYLNKTFQGDLKASDGTLLRNKNNETVNLNSFGLGIRLGVEFFFFKL